MGPCTRWTIARQAATFALMTRGGNTDESQSELIVVGGGLVGLTLAIACAEGGIRTIVVEAESAEALIGTAYDGRSAAVAYGSQQVLAAIGAWERLAPDAQPILDIRVTDGGWQVKGESPGYVHYSHLDLLAQRSGVRDQRSDTPGLTCEPESLARSDASRPGAPRSNPTSDIRQPTSEPFGYIIENRLTRIALLDRARDCASLTHLAPHVVTALDLT